MSNNKPMAEDELLQRIARGEDSRQQFKRATLHPDALAAELVAFANSGGGTLIIGVNDDGTITGLDAAGLRRLNQMLGNAASQHMRPPIHPLTQNVQTAHGLVVVVSVPDSLAKKPYLDHQGRIWVKQGTDKRQVTPQVMAVLQAIAGSAWSRRELMNTLNLKDRNNFDKLYLAPALEAGLIVRTIPEKPSSRLQKYHLTKLGERLLASQSKEGQP